MEITHSAPPDSIETLAYPHKNYTYETSVKESPYPGIAEIIVVVRTGDEEVKLNEFVFE